MFCVTPVIVEYENIIGSDAHDQYHGKDVKCAQIIDAKHLFEDDCSHWYRQDNLNHTEASQEYTAHVKAHVEENYQCQISSLLHVLPLCNDLL